MLPGRQRGGEGSARRSAVRTSAAIAANKAGDPVRTTRIFLEGVYQLEPGGLDRLPEATRKMFLDNARTAPLLFGGRPRRPSPAMH